MPDDEHPPPATAFHPPATGDHDLDVVAIGSPLLDVIELATTDSGRARAGEGLHDAHRPATANAVQARWRRPVTSRAARWPTRRPASPSSAAPPVSWEQWPTTRSGAPTPSTCAPRASSSSRTCSETAAGDGLGTGRCIVLITEDADRTMGTYLGAASTLTPEGVPTSFVARGSIVLLEGYLWDVPAAKEAMRHAAATAHAVGGLGRPLAVGPLLREPPPARVPRPPARRRRRPARQRGGAHDALRGGVGRRRRRRRRGDRAARRHDPRRAGCGRAHRAGTRSGAGGPGRRVVDTTGAGDLFAAGFLFGLTHGMGPVESTAPRRPVRGRDHLPHRRAARGRPEGAGRRRRAARPGSVVP